MTNRRPSGGLITLLSAGLLGALLVGVSTTPAAAKAPGDTALAIKAQARTGVYTDTLPADVEPYNDRIRYTGTLRTVDDDQPVEGATITLEALLSGDTEWTPVADVVTDAKGKARFIAAVFSNAKLRYSYLGDDTHSPSVSPRKTLRAMRDFNARLQEIGERAFLRGNINPGWDNRNVVWLRKTCARCAWHQVDHKQTDSNGSWRFRAGFPSKVGKDWYFRAKIAGTEDYVSSVSGVLHTYVTSGRGARSILIG